METEHSYRTFLASMLFANLFATQKKGNERHASASEIEPGSRVGMKDSLAISAWNGQ